MLDTSNWFRKGLIKSLAYEYLQEYDLTDDQIEKLCHYLSMIFINEIYDYYHIDEDIEAPACSLYKSQEDQEAYLNRYHPDIFEDKIFKLTLLYKDRERVIEDYYLHYLICDHIGGYDYDDNKELIRDIYCFALENKEDLLRNIKIEPHHISTVLPN